MMLSLPTTDLESAVLTAWGKPSAAFEQSASSTLLPGYMWTSELVERLFAIPSDLEQAEPQPYVRERHGWAKLQSSAIQRQGPEIGGNSVANIEGYFLFDDLPTSLLGNLVPDTRVGAAGYWHRLDSSASRLGLEPSLDVVSILSDLIALQAGWNGPDSVAPSAFVIDDITAALGAWSDTLRAPVVEVDDDGSVALLWQSDDQTFALTFLGNGKAVGTLSPRRSDYAAWSEEVSNQISVAARFNAPQVTSLIL